MCLLTPVFIKFNNSAVGGSEREVIASEICMCVNPGGAVFHCYLQVLINSDLLAIINLRLPPWCFFTCFSLLELNTVGCLQS